MNCASPRYLALATLTCMLAVSTYCLGKSTAMPARTVVRMALINVFVEDQETGSPVQDLNYTDFQIFDNGSLVEPSVFVSASTDTSRSIAMWLLVDCPEQGQSQSSAFLAGNLSALKQALAQLDSASTVGVGHWCADGDASIDSLPSKDHAEPIAALEAILHRAPVEPSKSSGARAFQRALDLIVKENQHPTSPALPVIVVMHEGSLDLSRDVADLMAKKLLYRGAILFQVKNPSEGTRGEHSPFQTISQQTGGRLYSVRNEDSMQAMSSIISALRFRYTLGLILHSDNREWHEIRVRLTKATLLKHKSVRVDYSNGYLVGGSFGTDPPYSTTNYQRKKDSDLDAILAQVLDNPIVSPHILFDFDGHGFIGSEHLVEFSLRLGSDQLTWSQMPNGDRRSQIEIVVASYSDGGKRIGHEVIQLEIVRDEAHLGITGDGPFNTSQTVILPEGTSRIRVAVRDVATEKVGCQDFSLKEILSAPRSPMVIR